MMVILKKWITLFMKCQLKKEKNKVTRKKVYGKRRY